MPQPLSPLTPQASLPAGGGHFGAAAAPLSAPLSASLPSSPTGAAAGAPRLEAYEAARAAAAARARRAAAAAASARYNWWAAVDSSALNERPDVAPERGAGGAAASYKARYVPQFGVTAQGLHYRVAAAAAAAAAGDGGGGEREEGGARPAAGGGDAPPAVQAAA